MRRALVLLVTAVLAMGCASDYAKGQYALRQGHYAEAEGYFMRALIEDPRRIDALVGLGVAQYKRGEIDLAIETLEKAVAARPKDANGQLYLGLAYLKKNDPTRAAEHLAALRGLPIDPRLAEQVDRALEVIRKEPLTDAVRSLLASNLDTAADLAREAAEARRDAQLAFPPPYMGYPYFGYPFYGYPFGNPYTPCVLVMRGGQPFCI
jgi:tetratricopeptide (TPR) repeat protein